MLIKIKCPCETYANACCACVSMHCDECHEHNKFQQGEFCSHCGRPLKAELQRNYVPRAEVERLQAEVDRLQKNNILPSKGFFNLLCGALVYTETLEEYNNFRRTIKAEVAMDIFEEIFDELRNIIVLTEKDFAELKKKYTEEQI